VIDMMRALKTGKGLEASLDVDEVLRYFAVNTFLVNLDSYAKPLKHNYFLYERNGLCRILPWDLNMSFGGYQMESATKAINFPIDRPVTDAPGNSPLIEKLLADPAYLARYHRYLSSFATEWVDGGRFDALIDKVDALISEHVRDDASAFYGWDAYGDAVANLRIFLRDRAVSVKAQIAGTQPSTSYGTVPTTLDLAALGRMSPRTMPQDLPESVPARR
jgi:spore coat protein CotH